MTDSVLDIKDLSIGFGSKTVVHGVSLSVARGEFHAIVGESGSGKTMVARAIPRLLPAGGRVSQGQIRFDGSDLLQMPAAKMRALRGARIGMVFQDPLTSLNPAMRIGDQMAEVMQAHGATPLPEIRAAAAEMLGRVGLSNPEDCLQQYPHHFSGGMRQRIMIASALLLKPDLLLADEPTTALDALVQIEIMELLESLSREIGVAVLFISHDLGLVADRADRVSVMEQGHLVETGPVSDVLNQPKHPCTRALLDALPKPPAHRNPPPETEPLLSVRDAQVSFRGARRALLRRAPDTLALKGVDVDLRMGETLAIVGASGSGKTTLGRAIVGLTPLDSGQITYDGTQITRATAGQRRALASEIQMVFQDPMSSLNPRDKVGDIVSEGLRKRRDLSASERRDLAAQTLEECGLERSFLERFPHQLSGGQRQRVGIARALVMRPKVIVLDEPVSALDITVQAQVLNLLETLKKEYGLAYLFISHDLGVVESIADRVMVMSGGQCVEQGTTDAVFSAPSHPFTCKLISALPELRATPTGYQLTRRSV